jgi:hypothetical protein
MKKTKKNSGGEKKKNIRSKRRMSQGYTKISNTKTRRRGGVHDA